MITVDVAVNATTRMPTVTHWGTTTTEEATMATPCVGWSCNGDALCGLELQRRCPVLELWARSYNYDPLRGLEGVYQGKYHKEQILRERYKEWALRGDDEEWRQGTLQGVELQGVKSYKE